MQHLLMLVDNMHKYELDPASIVEDTEWTWFCPQTDRRIDNVKPVYPRAYLFSNSSFA